MSRLVVRWDRIAGAILGMAMLASVFLLPFSSVLSIFGSVPDTTYNIFRFFLDNYSSIQAMPIDSLSLTAYLYLAGTIIIVIAGVLGTFALPSGLLGLSGISLTAIADDLSPSYSPNPISYGVGFYLLFALGFGQLGVWFWWRSQHRQPTTQPRPVPKEENVSV
jgi:hypothetical protein